MPYDSSPCQAGYLAGSDHLAFVDQSFVRTQEGLCLLKAGPGTCMVYLPTFV